MNAIVEITVSSCSAPRQGKEWNLRVKEWGWRYMESQGLYVRSPKLLNKDPILTVKRA